MTPINDRKRSWVDVPVVLG